MRVVATIATLSSREKQLEATVASLLPQVDVLCAYLNGHRKVPDCLRVPKVAHAVLSSEFGWRGAEAKMVFWDRSEWKAPPYWENTDVALLCDDDIVYPEDYVARMVEQLADDSVRPGPKVVCVHGSVIHPLFGRWSTDHSVLHFADELSRPALVHVPGTGTTAFRVGDVEVDLRSQQEWSHCVDLCFAKALRLAETHVVAVARPQGWLRSQVVRSGTVIYNSRSRIGNDLVETSIVKSIEWPNLPIPHEARQARIQ